MPKRSICGLAAVLALSFPAAAERRPGPSLSGAYTYTSTIICYQPGSLSPNFEQDVGVWQFHPRDGTAKVLADSLNILNPGSPVLNEGGRNLTVHYKIQSEHKMNLAGQDAYVQFGAVVNGIATSANLLYTNGNGSCTFQTTFTRVAQ